MLKSVNFCLQSLKRNSVARLVTNNCKYTTFFRRNYFCKNSLEIIQLKNSYKPFFRYPLRKSQKLLLAFSITGLLNFLNIPQDEDSELMKTLKMAESDFSIHQYAKAEKLFHLALSVSQQLQNEDAVTYIFDRLANIAFETGRNDKARTLFLRVMQRLIAKGMDKEDLIIIHLSFKMAKIFEGLKDYEQAELGYHYCLTTLPKKLTKENPDYEDARELWLMTLTGYAYFLFTMNKFNDAFEYFRKAYDVCIDIGGEQQERIIFLLNNLGTISRQKGDTENALMYLQKAENIGKNFPNVENLSFVYLNLGYLYLEQEILDKAKHYCRRAFTNANRHGFEEGLQKSEECLKEVMDAVKE